jgi:hypothetical protein
MKWRYKLLASPQKLLWCSGNTVDFESTATGSIPVGSFTSLSSVGRAADCSILYTKSKSSAGHPFESGRLDHSLIV